MNSTRINKEQPDFRHQPFQNEMETITLEKSTFYKTGFWGQHDSIAYTKKYNNHEIPVTP